MKIKGEKKMSGLLKSNQLSVIKRTIGDFIIYNVKTE